MEVSYRSYTDGDEYKIVDLLELVFNGWPKFDITCSSVDHWKWKYLDHPWKRYSISVGEIDEIIAVASSKYYPVRLVNGIYVCRQGGDLAVHPDYRGLRIASGNRDYRNSLPEHNNCDISIGASGSDIILKRRKKLGRPVFPRPIKIYSKILDFSKYTENLQDRLIKSVGYSVLQAYNKITHTIDSSLDDKIDIKTVKSFDYRLDYFWDKVCDKFLFSMVKNRDILNWRFADPRGGPYVIRVAEVDSEFVGYSVLRISRYDENRPVGFIVDLFSDPDALNVKSALVIDSFGVFKEEKVSVIKSIVVGDSPLEKAYKAFGFVEIKTNMEIAARNIKMGDEWDLFMNASSGHVEFQYGDIDWI